MTHNKNTFDKKLNSFNNFTKNWIARDRQRVVQLNWVRVRHGELLRGLETSREPQTYLCKCAACYLACRMRCHHVECGQAVGCSNEPDILQCERHIKGRYLRISNGIFFFLFFGAGGEGESRSCAWTLVHLQKKLTGMLCYWHLRMSWQHV